MSEVTPAQPRTTASILDEYCRYYSDFSKILGIYIKNIYPQFHFEFQQLLDASYNVWHRLNDEEKISLATFLEEMNEESNHNACSSLGVLDHSKSKCPKDPIWKNQILNPKSLALNTSSNLSKALTPKRVPITPFYIYLKDERQNFIRRHSKMSMREINKGLSERWQRMSARLRYKYEHRAYLAKKRLYKKQGKSVALKKPSFIKRMSSKTVQVKNKYQQLNNSSRPKRGNGNRRNRALLS